jgi:hypothetical protein
MIITHWKQYLIGTTFFLSLLGCQSLKEEKVVITKDYVINPNWSETNNSFVVYRMNLKDSSKSINLKNTTETELYHGLIQDTSFTYYANVSYDGKKYNDRKVYYNSDNGFLWWKDLHSSSTTKKILGELQQNTWYLLSGLSSVKTTLYYVYLDSLDSAHVFKVSTMTNY